MTSAVGVGVLFCEEYLPKRKAAVATMTRTTKPTDRQSSFPACRQAGILGEQQGVGEVKGCGEGGVGGVSGLVDKGGVSIYYNCIA